MSRLGVATKCLGAAAFVFACHSGVGTFAPSGYQHPEYPYLVQYADPQRKLLMSDEWQLDNFYEVNRSLTPKKGADYETTLWLDVNGDGKSDEVDTVQAFDLRFTNRKTSAVAWVRTIPIEPSLRDKELRVLMGGIVERISGGGYRLIQLGGSLYATTEDQRYAAKVIRSQKGTLAGRDAYAVVVNVSNVDKLKVDPKSVEARLMIVLCRTGIETRVTLRRKQEFPVLMIAELAAEPSDFDAAISDFAGLLNRISIGGKAGFTLEKPTEERSKPAPPTKPAVEPSAPAAEAATTSSPPDAGAPADAAAD